MSIIGDVLGGPISQAKLIVVALSLGAVIASGVGLYFYVSHLKTSVAELQADNKTLEENNRILQVNVDTLKNNQIALTGANSENIKTIDKLRVERKDAQRVIDTLSAEKQSSAEDILKLKKKIADMLKDPKNDGIVSPVLRETVRDIQNNRRP